MSHSHLAVYRLADLISGRVVPMTSIGEHAIFFEERGICVSANNGFPSILGNTIICKHRSTSQMEKTCDVRQHFCPRFDQFDIDSGTWSTALDIDILHKDRTPASPYTFSHHILTCCYRSYW
ncbi:hypothetical protein PR202_gb21914 [Eleusine coracana subsp. coracana]|uniref:Uncharacterized protein n=1 Tax=Eleusine coracana subsp. coracana TaxID=191504 RepID=A0AAV5FEF3_ELECO|nr:hypothetical protein PR202_gb21914 [Eleusine coracana subsp. coracana]